jgi:hypothetical protein
MSKLLVLGIALVLLLVALPLISIGTTQENDTLWWAGIALIVIGGLVPPVTRFVFGEGGEGEGEGEEEDRERDRDRERESEGEREGEGEGEGEGKRAGEVRQESGDPGDLRARAHEERAAAHRERARAHEEMAAADEQRAREKEEKRGKGSAGNRKGRGSRGNREKKE